MVSGHLYTVLKTGPMALVYDTTDGARFEGQYRYIMFGGYSLMGTLLKQPETQGHA